MTEHILQNQAAAQQVEILGYPPPVNPEDLSQTLGLMEFSAWLEAHPRKGRTVEEIDQYVREERDSWED